MERLIDINELSILLGVTKSTIYSWVSRQSIPHVKIGNRLLRFRESEITEWLQIRPEKRKSDHFSHPNTNVRQHRRSPAKQFTPDFIEQIIATAKKETLQC